MATGASTELRGGSRGARGAKPRWRDGGGDDGGVDGPLEAEAEVREARAPVVVQEGRLLDGVERDGDAPAGVRLDAVGLALRVEDEERPAVAAAREVRPLAHVDGRRLPGRQAQAAAGEVADGHQPRRRDVVVVPVEISRPTVVAAVAEAHVDRAAPRVAGRPARKVAEQQPQEVRPAGRVGADAVLPAARHEPEVERRDPAALARAPLDRRRDGVVIADVHVFRGEPGVAARQAFVLDPDPLAAVIVHGETRVAPLARRVDGRNALLRNRAAPPARAEVDLEVVLLAGAERARDSPREPSARFAGRGVPFVENLGPGVVAPGAAPGRLARQARLPHLEGGRDARQVAVGLDDEGPARLRDRRADDGRRPVLFYPSPRAAAAPFGRRPRRPRRPPHGPPRANGAREFFFGAGDGREPRALEVGVAVALVADQYAVRVVGRRRRQAEHALVLRPRRAVPSGTLSSVHDLCGNHQ